MHTTRTNTPKLKHASPHPSPKPDQFLIAGLVRNCGQHIKRDISRLSVAANCLADIHWLVIESDSTDDTTDKLKDLSSEIANFRYLSLGNLREAMPLRTDRIAFCRNKYLEELENNPIYSRVEYLIVADLDGLNDSISEQALMSCWTRDDWDVCTANQRGPYYDVSALRHKDWSPNNCWSQFQFLTRQKVDRQRAMQISIYSRMIVIPENSEWIEVDSAFGGLAIYRRLAIAGARYVGLDSDGDQICEHVTLHAKLKEEGIRIFINPRLINAFYTEHTLGLEPTAKRRLKRFLRSILVSIVGTDRIDKLRRRLSM